MSRHSSNDAPFSYCNFPLSLKGRGTCFKGATFMWLTLTSLQGLRYFIGEWPDSVSSSVYPLKWYFETTTAIKLLP